ncbi:MAG: histidinol-phosphate transaminase [Verrucomicrobiota bacterium]
MSDPSLRDLANDYVLDLVPYEPGKPVDDVARELGLAPEQVIKLASNENPLGPSPKAVAAMQEAVANCHFYPDGGGFHLRNALAEKFGLERANVVLGNGSNEILELLFKGFTRPGAASIVTNENAFAVYELMAQLFGLDCLKAADGPGFAPDINAMLAAVRADTRLVFLASPNNPTGTRSSNEDIDRLVHGVPPHVIVCLDEAYYEFLDDAPDTLAYLREGRRVVLIRTFSKIQGLAGLRIGYGLTTTEIADVLQRSRQPFNANLIAQVGALAALADTEHMDRTKAVTLEGRERLRAAFEEMGLEQIPSEANFILVRVGDGDAVFQALLRRGIIVRSMKSYRQPEFIRVSIGTPEQMERFIRELPAALEAAGVGPTAAAS